MRHFALLLLALLIVACRTTDRTRDGLSADPSIQQTEAVATRARADAEAEVKAAVEAVYAALSAENPDAIEPYVPSEGYSEFPVKGGLIRYDMRRMRSGLTGQVGRQFAVEDLKVETYGDAAVATGYRVRSAKMPDGNVEADTRRLSMVWARMDEQWKLVHVHLSPASTHGAPLDSNAMADIRAAHTSWFDAILAEDVSSLDSLLSDDMTFHAPGGSTVSKASFIGNLRQGRLAYDSLAVEPPLIRLYGQTAIVTGRADILHQWENQQRLEWLNYTAAYGSTPAGWRMVAWQSTFRPDSPWRD